MRGAGTPSFSLMEGESVLRRVSATRYLIFVFVFAVATNLIHPVTPMLLQRIGCPDYMFGVAFAMMSFTNFLTCPFWGRMGDRYGYIRIHTVGILGYALGQYIFSTATGTAMVVVGRAVSGCFASANMVCGMAYLARSTQDGKRRTRYMAIYAALNTAGAAGGYLTGGLIGDFSIPLVFILQVASCVFLGLALYALIGEVQTALDKSPLSFGEINPIASILSSAKMITVPMATFLLASFLANFATWGHDNAFNYYLRAQLDFPPSGNGIFKSVVGIIGLVANFTLNMWISARTDMRKSIVVLFGLCSASLVLMVTLPGIPAFLITAVAFYTVNAIYMPIQQSLIVRNDDGSATGALSGIFVASRSLGMVLGPLFSGFAYSVSAELPFIAAAAAFFLAAATSWINQKQYSRLEAARDTAP